MNVFDVPTDPAFWQDPHPFYEKALRTGDGLFAMTAGGYAVLGHRALSEIGRDPRAEGHPFPEGGLGEHIPEVYQLMKWGLFALGAPEHRPLRLATMAGLSASRIDGLRAGLVTAARALREEMSATADADVVREFAKPLAGLAFCDLIGLPREEAGWIVGAVDLIAAQLNGEAPEQAGHANVLARRMMDRLRELEHEGSSEVMRDIAERLPAGSPVGAADLVAAFAFDNVEMLAAGVSGVLEILMRNREALKAGLGAGAFGLGAAVQEAYRLASPAILTSRMAREEMVWNGHAIPAGAPLMMWWAAGNVDGSVFRDPLRFDPARQGQRHLAFGIGGHGCIGRHLGGLAAELAAQQLLIDADMRPAGEVIYLPRLARIAGRMPVAFA